VLLSVVYWQPTGGLMAQANLCGKVRSHGCATLCIHHMNWVNSHNAVTMMTAHKDCPGIITIICPRRINHTITSQHCTV